MPPEIDPRTPPTLSPVAAQRWWRDVHAADDAPWLHREVASRMLERLDLLKLPDGPKLLWQPRLAGSAAQQAFGTRFGALQTGMVEDFKAFFDQNVLSPTVFTLSVATKNAVNEGLKKPGRLSQILAAVGLSGSYLAPAAPQKLSAADATAAANAQLICSNLLVHAHAAPGLLIADWYAALAVGGCAMFSALGVDTGKELAKLHQELGFGPSAAQLTDMHDWGDMLVAQGFANPVMEMEHLKVTYSSADALLADWRGFGRNAHVARFAALRGRRWLDRYKSALTERLAQADGSLAVTVELIYGHAFKPEPKLRMSAESAISMREMRQMLSKRQPR